MTRETKKLIEYINGNEEIIKQIINLSNKHGNILEFCFDLASFLNNNKEMSKVFGKIDRNNIEVNIIAKKYF